MTPSQNKGNQFTFNPIRTSYRYSILRIPTAPAICVNRGYAMFDKEKARTEIIARHCAQFPKEPIGTPGAQNRGWQAALQSQRQRTPASQPKSTFSPPKSTRPSKNTAKPSSMPLPTSAFSNRISPNPSPKPNAASTAPSNISRCLFSGSVSSAPSKGTRPNSAPCGPNAWPRVNRLARSHTPLPTGQKQRRNLQLSRRLRSPGVRFFRSRIRTVSRPHTALGRSQRSSQDPAEPNPGLKMPAAA